MPLVKKSRLVTNIETKQATVIYVKDNFLFLWLFAAIPSACSMQVTSGVKTQRS